MHNNRNDKSRIAQVKDMNDAWRGLLKNLPRWALIAPWMGNKPPTKKAIIMNTTVFNIDYPHKINLHYYPEYLLSSYHCLLNFKFKSFLKQKTAFIMGLQAQLHILPENSQVSYFFTQYIRYDYSFFLHSLCFFARINFSWKKKSCTILQAWPFLLFYYFIILLFYSFFLPKVLLFFL